MEPISEGMDQPRHLRGRLRLLAAALAGPPVLPVAAHGAPPPDYDARAAAPPVPAPPSTHRAQKRLRRALGRQGVVRVDPSTGTPRLVGRLDGPLTTG